MQTVEEYRKRAQEALELAQRARVSERPTLLNIVQIWLRLADEREAELSQASYDSAAQQRNQPRVAPTLGPQPHQKHRLASTSVARQHQRLRGPT
jgi:hypothetical protein